MFRVSFLMLVLALAIAPHPAQAYIDPGTGSIVFQALVAGILGAFFTIKMYWLALKKKIREFFLKRDTGAAGGKKPDAGTTPED